MTGSICKYGAANFWLSWARTAGKTTAISLLLGLEQPDAGSARLFGQPPQMVETRRNIGVMMQEVALAQELRVREQIDLVASYYPSPMTPEAAMEMTHTTSWQTVLTESFPADKNVRHSLPWRSAAARDFFFSMNQRLAWT